MELYYSALSDVGNVRTNNEDYFYAGKIRENEYLFIVADGMGGHKAGEIASMKAVNVFKSQVEKGISNQISEDLKRIVLKVNDILIKEGRDFQEKNGMGTTLSVLYTRDSQAYIAHVGDSRIYRFSNLEDSPLLEQLTDDHSFVGKLLKDGYITEEEARNHPRRNVLYQSIGLKPDITVQTSAPIPIEKNQKFLLCSDGLYGVVSDRLIAEFLQNKSLSHSVKQLIRKAKTNGGPDNITAIIISTEKDTSGSEDTSPEDITKIDTPALSFPTKSKPKRIGFYILIALLLFLLAAIIFIILQSGNSTPDSSREKINIEQKN